MAILHDVVNGVGKHLYYLGYCAQHSQYVLCTMYPLDCLDDSQVQNNQAYTCICIQKEGRLSKASGPSSHYYQQSTDRKLVLTVFFHGIVNSEIDCVG